jgi:protein-ribulosamine 3-kinase
MMEGSFESECIFYQYCPDHVPKPVAWGNYESDPSTWFYLCDFNDMADEVPESEEFVSIVAQIHKSSMGKVTKRRIRLSRPDAPCQSAK